MGDDDRAARIVRFWRSVEMLSPQDVPKIKPYRRGAGEQVLDVERDELAPWEPGHPLLADPLPEHSTWKFTVYGGGYPLSAVSDALVKAFGQDAHEERQVDGQAALFALTIDADGCLVENGATLSACAWALGRLTSSSASMSNSLDGFDAEAQTFVDALDKLVPPDRLTSPEQNRDDDAGAYGPLARAVHSFGTRLKSASVDAWVAGSEAAGTVVKSATETAIGPVVGEVAGATAGKFTESMLGPGDLANDGDGPDGTGSITNQQPKTPRLLVTASALHDFVAELSAAMGVHDSLKATGIRVRCRVIPVRDDADEKDFLNSRISDDLGRIAEGLANGDAGTALRDYLSDERTLDTAHRVDVRARPETVMTGVEPQHIPAARWPTDPAKPLVLSQQFAVNRVVSELGDKAGLFSVNGPPGTGKTTLLRDVLAAIVVERANCLADLASPVDGFTERLEKVAVGPKEIPIPVYGVAEALTGFETVLATATNDAARNVTAEVPGIDAVRGYADEALAVDYFRDLASHVLDDQAWALVAATLGNVTNRNTFAKRFWWGDDMGAQKRRSRSGSPTNSVGMHQLLKEAANAPDVLDDWETTVSEFLQARDEVRRLTDTRQRAADSISAAKRCRERLRQAKTKFAELDAECATLTEDLAVADSEVNEADWVFRDADEDYDRHIEHKPGFWVSLSTWFRAGRRWQAKHEALETAREGAKQKLRETERTRERVRKRLSDKLAERQIAEEARASAEHDLERAQNEVTEAHNRWPGCLPMPTDFATDDEFQQCAPWADEEFVMARNHLFLKALRLHRVFVLHAHSRIKNNLSVMTEALQGNAKPSSAARLAVWQSLFLVVPMISTTFDSLPRLFTGLGRESLGWLLVDEAGQATPQQVVGGLWRCQRAVVVGDPQQLEPIVALPTSAQHALRRHYQVDEQWAPETTSAQGVADRLTRYGTALPVPDSDETVWVGAPLRVHRRCDRPMFEVSNDIAYGGTLMVYGTRHSGEFPGENRWIDVRSSTHDGHWIRDEGNALSDLFKQLMAERVDRDEIRVISPFRDVVNEAKSLLHSQLGWEFAKRNVGTVHTVQGKESDVIVLVLGSAPNRPRARQWAAGRPNLLNVAVSRAKRRLYVIGNRSLWKDLRYFDRLAYSLPVDEWR